MDNMIRWIFAISGGTFVTLIALILLQYFSKVSAGV